MTVRFGSAAAKLARIAAFAGVALVAAAFAAIIAALPLGYRSVVAYGPSMGHAVRNGSLVVGKLTSRDDVQVGDVIIVHEVIEGARATPKVHRVISVDARDGQILVITKGDANSAPDPTPYVLPARTLRVIATVPVLGFLVRFVESPLGWLGLIVVPALSLSVVYLQKVWRKDPEPAAA